MKPSGNGVWVVSKLSRAGVVLFCLLGALSASSAQFDQTHARWTEVLSLHVRDGLVNYAALSARPEGLDQYLDQLASVKQVDFQAWSEPERIAFLCNAYNAYTLRLILGHYPLTSIKSIGGLFRGPWDQPVVNLFGETRTLGFLEHKVLREDYNEPRVHFALVCAAKGCPPLRNEAYQGARLEEQLVDQARRFLAQTDKNRVDASAGVVYLSPIFKWYRGDFERKNGSVLKGLEPYWPEGIHISASFKIRFSNYDWSLNEQGE